MRADPDREAVRAAIDAFFDHVANRRLEATLDCFSGDDDVALFGSEVSESIRGGPALRRFFETLLSRTGPRFSFSRPDIALHGDVAWFTVEGQVESGGTVISPYRLTGILKREAGRWRWVLFNGSEPHPDRA